MDLNFLAIDKDPVAGARERYIFLFDNCAASYQTSLQTFGRYASDPELSFTWYDAAVLSQRLRAIAREYKNSHSEP